MTTAVAHQELAEQAKTRRNPAAPSHTIANPDDLRDLMQAVTETTQRLQATHISLQNQVSRLQGELAEANAALRRSQALAALGEMAAGIAHEVRNPLGSIQLYVQMLAEDLADRPAQAKICGKIDRAVIGLDAIVRDVLAFARNTTIDPQPTTADELMDRAISGCQGLLAGSIRVIREFEKTPLRLHADLVLITQALGNIIRNAVEAMSESSAGAHELRLHTSRRKVRCTNGKQEMRIILSVQDSGPGIPADVMDRLFNPFFTTRKTGTGLGLAIVHRIVDAHGGDITIQNVSTGGARVDVCLPIKPPAQSSQSAPHR